MMKSKHTLLSFLLIFSLVFNIGCTQPENQASAATRKVVATAEIISGGDLLISESVLKGAETESGKYNFDHIFKYVDEYIKDADYAVINLETSLAGKKAGYCGFPKFNTPSSIVTAAKKAGFDMFLTASNHSYDLGYSALIYKINVLNDKNVQYVGTRKNTGQSFHKVVKVNGIKIGILNYTQEHPRSTAKKTILNVTRDRQTNELKSVTVDKKGKKLISMYNQDKLPAFYQKMETDINKLKEKGAEIIVAYPHWGKEYNIDYNDQENNIAQKMCDLGVDVIIGGHPHVVEPTKVYTSKKSGKTTICIHSTGNFVSSMGAHQADEKDNAEYTEDGALFTFTAKKYNDGTVAVTSAEVLPIWVLKDEDRKYTVIPLDKRVDWEDEYGISNKSEAISSGCQSYKRTTSLVSKGIQKFNKMPKVIKQPVKKSVKSGKKAVFKIKTVGKNVKYQWQYSNNGGKTWKNSNAKGNKSATATVQVRKKYDGRFYRCKVTTSAGTAYSKKAKLTVTNK